MSLKVEMKQKEKSEKVELENRKRKWSEKVEWKITVWT